MMKVSCFGLLVGIALLGVLALRTVVMARDINLDVPRFKAGDCLIYIAPMQANSNAIKIKEVNSLTFRGETSRSYEITDGNETFMMQTWAFDMGEAEKFRCADFVKIKAELDQRNKLAAEEQERLAAEREAEFEKEAKKQEENKRKEAARLRERKRQSEQIALALKKTQDALSTRITLGGFYWEKVEAIIKSNWVIPMYPNMVEQEAIMKFRAYANGKIVSVELQKSSGNAEFDSACIEAVKRSQPLPNFGYHMRGDSYQDAEIEFRMPLTH